MRLICHENKGTILDHGILVPPLVRRLVDSIKYTTESIFLGSKLTLQISFTLLRRERTEQIQASPSLI